MLSIFEASGQKLEVLFKLRLDLVNDEKYDIDEGSPNLLEIRRCSLHVLLGTFKTIQSATTRQVEKCLKACIYQQSCNFPNV